MNSDSPYRRQPTPMKMVYPQHDFCCWIGGHGTLPQEQNTQQSPGLGCNNLPQAGQS